MVAILHPSPVTSSHIINLSESRSIQHHGGLLSIFALPKSNPTTSDTVAITMTATETKIVRCEQMLTEDTSTYMQLFDIFWKECGSGMAYKIAMFL